MSKAFTKDDASSDPVALPSRRPLPPGTPNYVTARGLESLRRKGWTLVAVVVEDAGGGVAASGLARLGEPFVSTKGRGRGLGVLNVKKMVESVHGGTFTLETIAGGARATMVVPRKQPAWGAA